MIPKLENIARVRVLPSVADVGIYIEPVPIDFKERVARGGERYVMVRDGDGYQKVRPVPLEALLNAMIEDNRRLRAQLETLRAEVHRQSSGEDY